MLLSARNRLHGDIIFPKTIKIIFVEYHKLFVQQQYISNNKEILFLEISVNLPLNRTNTIMALNHSQSISVAYERWFIN